MSRAHQEIFNLGRRLSKGVKAMPAEGSTPEILRELQRNLYTLDAILRRHFAQEDEVYETPSRFSPAGLSEDPQRHDTTNPIHL
jgi:hypothetical protein